MTGTDTTTTRPSTAGPQSASPAAPAGRPVHVQEGVYRADKVLHHTEHVQALRAGRAITPVTAHFVISDLCNHDCSFCSFRMEDNLQNAWFGEDRAGGRHNNPARMIPTPKVFEILHDMAVMGVRGVEFTGGGEPTVHPDHVAIFERCLDLGMDASLITNGQLVKPDLDPVLADFTWVRFSIDAANAATWAAVRRVSPRHFDRVLENARRLIRHRDDVGSATTIGAGFVVYEQNWREVHDAVRLFKDIGFDSVRIGAIFNSSQKAHHFDGFAEAAAELCAAAKADFEDDGFSVANNFEARLDDLGSDGRPDYPRCYYQELVAYIGGDQQLYRCCDTAYNPIGHLGSLVGTSFRELWTEVCETGALTGFRPDAACEFCMFNNRNRLVADFVDDPDRPLPGGAAPPHENFV